MGFSSFLDFQCLDELHSAVLVKTNDVRPDVIEDAMLPFQAPAASFDGIVRAEAFYRVAVRVL